MRSRWLMEFAEQLQGLVVPTFRFCINLSHKIPEFLDSLERNREAFADPLHHLSNIFWRHPMNGFHCSQCISRFLNQTIQSRIGHLDFLKNQGIAFLEFPQFFRQLFHRRKVIFSNGLDNNLGQGFRLRGNR